MNKKENLRALVSKEETSTVSRNKERIKNRKRLRESQQIALKVLSKLDELGWSQKRLAAEMGVSPQQITKIVKGKENLTLETQVKLQEVLNIPILATFYENLFGGAATLLNLHKFSQTKLSIQKKLDYEQQSFTSKDYKIPSTKVIRVDFENARKPQKVML